MSFETLNRIEGKIDNLDSRMDKVDVRLAVYNEQLVYHVKRTDLLEEAVAPVIAHVKALESIRDFAVTGGKFFTWGLGIAGGIVGLVAGIKALF